MFAMALKRFLNTNPGSSVWMHGRVYPPKTRYFSVTEHCREWLAGMANKRLQADLPAVIAMPLRDGRFKGARCEFIDALDDIPGPAADEAITRIYAAASMHDLWHLRLDVFNLVACRHDQAKANHRLLQLNRHFPTRSMRSGFGALGGR